MVLAAVVKWLKLKTILVCTGNEKLRYRDPIPTWILLCGRYRLMFAIPPTHYAQ
jgi:hypothetical protein